MEEQLTSALIEATDALNLNLWGRISLSIFSEEAIRFGLLRLKVFKDASNPFLYFMSQAKQYSYHHKIPLNWTRCNTLQLEYKMPADTDTFVESIVYNLVTNEPVIDKPSNTQWYQHKEVILDFDEECRKWHEIIINWDNIEDPKKKCHKDWKLSYPGYLDWLKKVPIETLIKQDVPEVILYATSQDAIGIDTILRSI